MNAFINDDNNDDGDDNEIFEEHSIPIELRPHHRTLSCQMCGGLYDKAVSIQHCGHTFCSVCIRSYFQSTSTGIHRQNKKSCPICRYVIVDDNIDRALIINRTVQESVHSWKDLLRTIHCQSKQQQQPQQQEEQSSKSSFLLSLSTNIGETASAQEATTTTTSSSSSSSSSIQVDVSSRRKGNGSNGSYPSMGQSNDTDHDNSDGPKANNDRPIDTKLPRLNYSTMKKKQLLELCRKRGLPTTSGTDDELRDLHRRYVIKYNAELDNTTNTVKRTPTQVITELLKEMKAQKDEHIRSTLNGSKNHSVLLKALHTSGGVSSGNAKFDKILKGNFKTMIAQAQARQTRGKVDTKSEQDPIRMTSQKGSCNADDIENYDDGIGNELSSGGRVGESPQLQEGLERSVRSLNNNNNLEYYQDTKDVDDSQIMHGTTNSTNCNDKENDSLVGGSTTSGGTTTTASKSLMEDSNKQQRPSSSPSTTSNSIHVGVVSSTLTSSPSSLDVNIPIPNNNNAPVVGLKQSSSSKVKTSTPIPTSSVASSLSPSYQTTRTATTTEEEQVGVSRKRRSPTLPSWSSSSTSSLSSSKRQQQQQQQQQQQHLVIDVDMKTTGSTWHKTTTTSTTSTTSGHRRSSSLRNRNWSCTVCTYNNLSMDTKCAMCRAPKGS